MRPMPAECTSALGGWCGGPGLPTTVLPVRPPRLFSPPEATVPGQLETAPGNGAEFAAPAVGRGEAGCRSASVPGKRRGAHKGEAAPPGGPCRRQRGGEWREPVAAGCSRQDGMTSPHGHLGSGWGDVPSRPPGPGIPSHQLSGKSPPLQDGSGRGERRSRGGQGGDSGRDINMAALLAAGRRSSVFGSCPRTDAFAGGQRL